MTSDTLDWRYKALPASVAEVDVDAIALKGWNVLAEDVMLPAAILRQSALEHNLAWMKRFCREAGVEICPHGKTTMSPSLFEAQLAAGAWGITAATVAQVRVYRAHGIDRIILANQLVGKQNIDFMLAEIERDPGFDFYCLVDSREGAELLEAALNRKKSTRGLQVLLELGLKGGRAGVRDVEDAHRLAEHIALSPNLHLRGIEAFEGIVRDDERGEDEVRDLIKNIVTLAERCFADGLFAGKPILTAGGSAHFDFVTEGLGTASLRSRFTVVLRSGCYITHDSDFYQGMIEKLMARAKRTGPSLQPALEVWAHVISRPENGRVIAGLGKRDISFDMHLPKPLGWARPGSKEVRELGADHRTVRLNDHHAYVDVPADSPLQVGDLIYFGISHPCTTFDRWPALFVVDDDRTIVGAIRTYF